MRRPLDILLVVLALVLLGVIIYPQYKLTRPTPIRIGCDRSVASLPIFLAGTDSLLTAGGGWEPGYFAQHKIIPEIVYYDDPDECLAALKEGALDCAVLPWFHILKALEGGETLKVFLSSEFRGSIPVDAILIRKGARMDRVSDLRGRRVGVMPQLRELCEVFLRAAKIEEGEVIELTAEELIPAVLAGRVDAGFLIEPYRTLAVAQGAEVLADGWLSRWVHSPFPGVGVCARSSFIEKRHRAAVRLHTALDLAAWYIDRQPAQAQEVLAQFLNRPGLERVPLPEFQRLSAINRPAVQTFANRLSGLGFLSPGIEAKPTLIEPAQLR